MKKVFEFIGWVLFILAIAAGFTAALCTLGGVISLFMALCNIKYAMFFAFFAIVYFVAIAILFIIYLMVSTYWAIEKAWAKR